MSSRRDNLTERLRRSRLAAMSSSSASNDDGDNDHTNSNNTNTNTTTSTKRAGLCDLQIDTQPSNTSEKSGGRSRTPNAKRLALARAHRGRAITPTRNSGVGPSVMEKSWKNYTSTAVAAASGGNNQSSSSRSSKEKATTTTKDDKTATTADAANTIQQSAASSSGKNTNDTTKPTGTAALLGGSAAARSISRGRNGLLSSAKAQFSLSQPTAGDGGRTSTATNNKDSTTTGTTGETAAASDSTRTEDTTSSTTKKQEDKEGEKKSKPNNAYQRPSFSPVPSWSSTKAQLQQKQQQPSKQDSSSSEAEASAPVEKKQQQQRSSSVTKRSFSPAPIALSSRSFSPSPFMMSSANRTTNHRSPSPSPYPTSTTKAKARGDNNNTTIEDSKTAQKQQEDLTGRIETTKEDVAKPTITNASGDNNNNGARTHSYWQQQQLRRTNELSTTGTQPSKQQEEVNETADEEAAPVQEGEEKKEEVELESTTNKNIEPKSSTKSVLSSWRSKQQMQVQAAAAAVVVQATLTFQQKLQLRRAQHAGISKMPVAADVPTKQPNMYLQQLRRSPPPPPSSSSQQEDESKADDTTTGEPRSNFVQQLRRAPNKVSEPPLTKSTNHWQQLRKTAASMDNSTAAATDSSANTQQQEQAVETARPTTKASPSAVYGKPKSGNSHQHSWRPQQPANRADSQARTSPTPPSAQKQPEAPSAEPQPEQRRTYVQQLQLRRAEQQRQQEKQDVSVKEDEKKEEEGAHERASTAITKARHGTSTTTSCSANQRSPARPRSKTPSYMRPTQSKKMLELKTLEDHEEVLVAAGSPRAISRISHQQEAAEVEEQLDLLLDDKEPWSDTIEKPEKVNVASMKSLFGSTKTTAAPRDRRSMTPTPPQKKLLPGHQTNPSRSASAGRYRAAPPSLDRMTKSPPHPSWKNSNKSNRQPPSEPTRVASPARLSEPKPETPSNVTIEKPEKVSVQSMSARFMKPTASTAAKQSPSCNNNNNNNNSSAAKCKLLSQQNEDEQETESALLEETLLEEQPPRSVIETPDRVSVANMKGMFGNNKNNNNNSSRGRQSYGGTPGSYGNKAKTPHNTPMQRTPPKRPHSVSRIEQASPQAPPVPNRTTTSSSVPWRARSSLDSNVVHKELRPPPWVRPDSEYEPKDIINEAEQNAEGNEQEGNNSPQPSSTETSDQAREGTASSSKQSQQQNRSNGNDKSLRSKSTRNRPSNIPTMKTRNPLSQDNVPGSSHTLLSKEKGDDDSDDIAEDGEKAADLSENQKQQHKEEDNNTNRPPKSPVSSPSRDRPWMRDAIAKSPVSWKRKMSSPKNRLNNEAKTEPELVSPVEEKPKKVDRMLLLRQQMMEEDPFVEEKKDFEEDDVVDSAGQKQSSMFSLTQMAVDSIHAVDFDQAMLDIKHRSPSQEEDESVQSNDVDASIPCELPPEFAKLSANQSKPKASRFSERVAKLNSNRASHHATNEHHDGDDGIVFGDPNTYGAAGGDEGKTPPKVADRARAIANWKGGLGVKSSKSNSTCTKSETEDETKLLELIETKSSDILYSDPMDMKSPDENENRDSANSPFGGKKTKKKKPLSTSPAKTLSPSAGASSILKYWSKNTSPEKEKDDSAWETAEFDQAPAAKEEQGPSSSPPRSAKNSPNNRGRTTSGPSPGTIDFWKTPKSPIRAMSRKAKYDAKKMKKKAIGDPFSLSVMASSLESPNRKQLPNEAAFDPFWDTAGAAAAEDDPAALGVDGSNGNRSTVLDFFNAAIQVRHEPAQFSPTCTDFSMPNFEPAISTEQSPVNNNKGMGNKNFDDDYDFGRALLAPSGSPSSQHERRKSHKLNPPPEKYTKKKKKKKSRPSRVEV